MKNVLTLCLTLAVLGMFNYPVMAQQTAKKVDGIGYLEYLPPGYNDNSNEKFPVIIFLHGIGERGDGSASDLNNKVAKNGPPKKIKQGQDMCFTVNGKEECFIVISPQLASNKGLWSPAYVDVVVDHVLNSGNYKVDKSRVYLTGLSLGGGGVWSYAYSDYNSPNQFAAIAPIASWGSTNKGCTISERGMAVWAFHGDEDPTVAYNKGLNMFNAVKSCTSPKAKAALKFTTYEGVKHNSWSRAYATDHSVHNPNLYEWLLKQKKGSSSNDDDDDTNNTPPVASAGNDISIQLPTTTLTIHGKGTSGSSTIKSYLWSKLSGPSATLTNKTSKDLKLEGLKQGTYKFRLKVTDNNSLSDTDDVVVIVNPAPSDPVDNDGSWLELTTKDSGGKVVSLYYNNQKDKATMLPVTATGNNKLTFLLKKVSGNPDWRNMEVRLTAGYQTKAVVIKNYVSAVSSSWTQVSIPLSAFKFDNGKLNDGVSSFELKMLGGFGKSVFGLDEVVFKGGSSEFVWYGDEYTISGNKSSVDETSDFYISGRKSDGSSDDNDDDSDDDGGSGSTTGGWLEVTTKDAGGKSLVLYYNAQKDNNIILPVTSSGNNKLSFKLKVVSGTPDWEKMEAQLTATYQRKGVAIGDYVRNIGSNWIDVTIPLSDFGFDASRISIGVSDFQLKMRSGFGASVFGIDEIKFTGGSQAFVWYGDDYTTSGSAAAVVQNSDIYISARKSSGSSQTPDDNNSTSWLEATTKDTGGKALVLYYNNQKDTDVIMPVTATGNNKLTFKLKRISGNPNWNNMEVQLTATYQRKGVAIGDYVTQIGANWVEVSIPLSDFNLDASRLSIGVSDVQLKMRANFGASVFGLDEIKFTGGTREFVWYGDAYTVSGQAGSVDQTSDFYISKRNSGSNSNNNTYSPSVFAEVTTQDAGGKVLAMYYNSRKDKGYNLPVVSGGNNKLTFYIKEIEGNPNWNNMDVVLTASYQAKLVTIGKYVSNVGSDWVKVSIPLSDFKHSSGKLAGGVSDVEFKLRAGFGAAVFGLADIKFTGGSNEFVWYGSAYSASANPGAVDQCPEIYISKRYSNGNARVADIPLAQQIEDQFDDNGEKKVEVYDFHGRKIKDALSDGNTKDEILDDIQLSSGLYIIKVETKNPEIQGFKVRIN